jgi:hypothetical protein
MTSLPVTDRQRLSKPVPVTTNTRDNVRNTDGRCILYASGLQRGARENILQNRLNLEPALILALNEDSSPNSGADMP